MNFLYLCLCGKIFVNFIKFFYYWCIYGVGGVFLFIILVLLEEFVIGFFELVLVEIGELEVFEFFVFEEILVGFVVLGIYCCFLCSCEFGKVL